MPNFINDTIEYSGIANVLPQMIYPACFSHDILQEDIVLPAEKPDIVQLVRIMAEIKILGSKVLKTIAGVSGDGQLLTGKKLVVEGEIKQRFEYVSNTCSGELYAEYIITPFVKYVVIPNSVKNGAPISASGYIKNMEVRLIDNRSFLNSISVIIIAEC